MALIDKNIKITSVERDEKRYLEAVKNIKKFNLEDRIKVIYADALEVELNENFDLIFIDAAKSQYIKFFEKFDKNLKIGGVIFSDNLNFHGLTHTNEFIPSRNVRGIVRKLNNYINYLKELTNYKTTFLDIGDGISISVKIEDK